MKKTNETEKIYESPEMKTFETQVQSVICQSATYRDLEKGEFNW